MLGVILDVGEVRGGIVQWWIDAERILLDIASSDVSEVVAHLEYIDLGLLLFHDLQVVEEFLGERDGVVARVGDDVEVGFVASVPQAFEERKNLFHRAKIDCLFGVGVLCVTISSGDASES